MKTSELTGAALDWAVAKAEGKLITLFCGVMVRENDGMLSPSKNNPLVPYTPSTNWAQGGPIIEREGIRVEPEAYSATGFTLWRADIPKGPTSPHGYKWTFGATPLIAAMRCYVASKLGDMVDVPTDLTKE